MLVWSLFQTASAATLKEAFDAAKMNMETIKRADARVEQAKERKSQARAGILPTINLMGNVTRIDPPHSAGNSPFLLTRQYSTAIRLQQPIIRGGVIGAYQFAQEDILLSQFQKDANVLTLYQLVINSYYNLCMAQMDVANLNELLKLSSDRVKELKNRTQLGKTRKGELAQAETQLLTSQTQLQQGQIALKQAEESYAFYTLLPVEKLPNLGSLPLDLNSLGDYRNKVRTRPDIMASMQQIKLADRQISISKGAHYPSLDIVGNYYLNRTGVLSSSKWDAALVFTVPLFQGGGVSADVEESVQRKREAELTTHETVRAAERDVQILFSNYQTIIQQLNVAKDALKKAEEAYKLNNQDYRNGLATNLEVLQSLNIFIESKRTFNNLLAVGHMTFKNIEAQVGVLP